MAPHADRPTRAVLAGSLPIGHSAEGALTRAPARLALAVGLVLTVVALATGPPSAVPVAWALGTLDQQNTVVDAVTGVSNEQAKAQTFTAGLTGALDTVDLLLSPAGS